MIMRSALGYARKGSIEGLREKLRYSSRETCREKSAARKLGSRTVAHRLGNPGRYYGLDLLYIALVDMACRTGSLEKIPQLMSRLLS